MPEQESVKSPAAPQESFKPPMQPLDIKNGSRLPFWLIFFIVAGFAVAAAVFAFLSKGVSSSIFSRPKPSQGSQAVPSSLAQPLAEVVEPVPVEEKTKVIDLSVPRKPLPVLTLSGILFGEKGGFALINGRIIAVGAMIEGAKLEKVESDRAVLTFEDQTIILRAR